MAKYHTVSPNIWNADFRKVAQKGPIAGFVYCYLLSCRHRGSEGIFVLNKSYIAIDMGLESEAVDEALEVLIAAGYVSHDPENDVLLDRHALRDYQPIGDKQITGALNRLEQIPNSPLKKEFVKLAYISAPEFADEIVGRFPELAVDTPLIRYRYPIDTASRARARAPRGEELEKSRGSDSDSDLALEASSSNRSASHVRVPEDWS